MRESLVREGIGMAEFSRLFSGKVVVDGVPFSGSIDLTNRCNLRCVHCYLGDRRKESSAGELSTGRVLTLVDELAEAGCLFLLLTGGEPLVRSDFATIYRHARSRGILVSVFTNGTLIDPSFIQLMRELPPYHLEISLYGATETTFEAISQVSGSHAACMAGIALLAGSGVPFGLKTMLMQANRHEYHQMKGIAEAFGVPFRMDAGLFPRLDGDRSPMAQRLAPEDAVAIEFSDTDLARKWLAALCARPTPGPTKSLYECGAGRRTFHVKADGTLVPCVMFEHLRQPLAGGDFLAAWDRLRGEIASRMAGAGYACRECGRKELCGICPAFFLLETGDEETKSDFLCAIGRRRAEVLSALDITGGGKHVVCPER